MLPGSLRMEGRPYRGLVPEPKGCEEREGKGFLLVPPKDILIPILFSRSGGHHRGNRICTGPFIHCEPPKGTLE